MELLDNSRSGGAGLEVFVVSKPPRCPKYYYYASMVAACAPRWCLQSLSERCSVCQHQHHPPAVMPLRRPSLLSERAPYYTFTGGVTSPGLCDSWTQDGLVTSHISQSISVFARPVWLSCEATHSPAHRYALVDGLPVKCQG